MIYLDDLAVFLRETLRAKVGEMCGLYEPRVPAQRARSVRRLALALESGPRIFAWAEREALDALFLHRPWGAEDVTGPPNLGGVLAAHEAFDRGLGIGRSRISAEALGLSGLQACGWKKGAPLGWVGTTPLRFSAFLRRVLHVFGGLEAGYPPRRGRAGRVAVVGAMRGALVEEACAAGAAVYVTGQWRPAAALAVARTGIGVLAVGHRRSERWGLRALAQRFALRFAHLRVACAPPA